MTVSFLKFADNLGHPCNGAEGTRTPDPRVANAMLSQLSYRPVKQGRYYTHRHGFVTSASLHASHILCTR